MTMRDERQQFADAVAIANIPTLLMVLVQLTGERHWMAPPYAPSRADWPEVVGPIYPARATGVCRRHRKGGTPCALP